jgi:alpha-tubulin suppressor-like RCC1 family protein
MDAFCAPLSSGAVSCWTLSDNAQQQAGFNGIVQMARGDRHACALRNDGVLLCLGGGTEGELGNGLITTTPASTPAPVTVFANVVEVAAGSRSTCVRTRNSGFVQCLGNGATAGSPAAQATGNLQPVTALNLSNAIKIVAGEQHMCALTEDEVVRCWGSGLAAGNGLAAGSPSPFAVPLPGPAIDVGAGSFTSCALLEDTSVYCWGSFAPITASATPVLIEMP